MQDYNEFYEKTIHYFTQGIPCSESLIRAAYECGIIDNKNDVETLKKITSPCISGKGLDSNSSVCGTLLGAQMIIGCIIGRKDVTCPNEQLKKVSQKLVKEFQNKGHVTCCRATLENYNETPEEKYHNCAQTIKDIIDILQNDILQNLIYEEPSPVLNKID